MPVYKSPLDQANAMQPKQDYFGGITPPDLANYKFDDNAILIDLHNKPRRSEFLNNYLQELSNRAKRSVNSYSGETLPLKQYQLGKPNNIYWDEFESPMARKYNSQWNPDLVRLADDIKAYENSIVEKLGKYKKWNGNQWEE